MSMIRMKNSIYKCKQNMPQLIFFFHIVLILFVFFSGVLIEFLILFSFFSGVLLGYTDFNSKFKNSIIVIIEDWPLLSKGIFKLLFEDIEKQKSIIFPSLFVIFLGISGLVHIIRIVHFILFRFSGISKLFIAYIISMVLITIIYFIIFSGVIKFVIGFFTLAFLLCKLYPVFSFFLMVLEQILFLLYCIPPSLFYHKNKKSTFAEWLNGYWKTSTYNTNTLRTFGDIWKSLANLNTNIDNSSIIQCYFISLVLIFRFTSGLHLIIPSEFINPSLVHNIYDIFNFFLSKDFLLEFNNNFAFSLENVEPLYLSESNNAGSNLGFNVGSSNNNFNSGPNLPGGGNNNIDGATIVSDQDNGTRRRGFAIHQLVNSTNPSLQDLMNPEMMPIRGSFLGKCETRYGGSLYITTNLNRNYTDQEMRNMLEPFLSREGFFGRNIVMTTVYGHNRAVPAICVDGLGHYALNSGRSGVVIPNIMKDGDSFRGPKPKIWNNGNHLFFRTENYYY